MIDHRSYIRNLGRIPCHRTQIPLYVNITVKKEHSVLHLETIGFQSASFELVKGPKSTLLLLDSLDPNYVVVTFSD